jgi:hypothetical protein
MGALSASVQAELTADTYIKLALALSFPLVLYVVLLVVTKNMR